MYSSSIGLPVWTPITSSGHFRNIDDDDDLSAAFDTVDHATLLRRLEVSYGLCGHVQGMVSVIPRRPHAVCPPRYSLFHRHLPFVWSSTGVGSWTHPVRAVYGGLAAVGRLCQLCPHLHADDTRIYGSCHPSAVSQLQQQASACVDEVVLWMRSNWLQLNVSKTEVLWCASSRRQHQIPRTPVRVCTDFIQPASSVRDLRIYLDADVSMRTHVSRTVSNCFAVLRIWNVRRSLTRPVLQSLVVSLVMPRFDYGNTTDCRKINSAGFNPC